MMMSAKNTSRKKESYETLTARKGMAKVKDNWKIMVQATKILPKELTQDPNYENNFFSI